MPITYHLKPDEKLMILSHVGVVTDDEFLSFYKTLYGDPQFDKSLNFLIDLRQTDSSKRSGTALHEFAEFIEGQFLNIAAIPKVAVVAPKDVSFGLARMYEAFCNDVPWEFMVFRTFEPALSWLGLPKDMIIDLDREAQAEKSSDAE